MIHPCLTHRALTAIAACLCFAAVADAAAPTVKAQAPGYYRMMLGDFESTALSDGTVALPVRQRLRVDSGKLHVVALSDGAALRS